MSLSAIDAEDRALQLISLTERLTDRLAGETIAFESHRPHDAAAGIGETQRLANLYRHESARIKMQPELIMAARLETRRRLIRATEAFEAVLTRHGRAVAAARQVSEGLVKAIAEEIARNRPAASGYGPTARAPTNSTGAIALNRRA